MKKLFVISLIVIAILSIKISYSQYSSYEAKDKHLRFVAQNIWQSLGVHFQMPKIELVQAKFKNRKIDFYPPNKIIIGTDFFDSCMTIGDEALAAVLAHEFGHYFNCHKHRYTISGFFTTDSERKLMTDELKLKVDSAKMHEAQADNFAAFKCYSAGYNITEAFPKILKVVYSDATDKNPSNYLKLDERLLIAEKSLIFIKKLMLLFESANKLSIIQEYELSAKCFDYIEKRGYTSWEIYSNAGINYALAAVKLMPESKNRFIYPFELILNAQIDKINKSNSSRTRGTMDVEENIKTKINKLLMENYLLLAESRINRALQKVLNSSNLLTNYSCILYLKGDKQDARNYAIKALESAITADEKSLAYIAQGIIFSETDLTEADIAFSNASNSSLGNHNLMILRKQNLNQETVEEIRVRRRIESIGDITRNGLESLNYNYIDNYDAIENVSLDSLNIYIYEDKQNNYRALKISNKNLTTYFIETKDEYVETTKRGIRIGGIKKEVIEKYGYPSRVIKTDAGELLVYHRTCIIFRIADDKVQGWMLYYK